MGHWTIYRRATSNDDWMAEVEIPMTDNKQDDFKEICVRVERLRKVYGDQFYQALTSIKVGGRTRIHDFMPKGCF